MMYTVAATQLKKRRIWSLLVYKSTDMRELLLLLLILFIVVALGIAWEIVQNLDIHLEPGFGAADLASQNAACRLGQRLRLEDILHPGPQDRRPREVLAFSLEAREDHTVESLWVGLGGFVNGTVELAEFRVPLKVWELFFVDRNSL